MPESTAACFPLRLDTSNAPWFVHCLLKLRWVLFWRFQISRWKSCCRFKIFYPWWTTSRVRLLSSKGPTPNSTYKQLNPYIYIIKEGTYFTFKLYFYHLIKIYSLIFIFLIKSCLSLSPADQPILESPPHCRQSSTSPSSVPFSPRKTDQWTLGKRQHC